MMEAFREGYDIHRATAAKIWHEDIDKVTDAQRKKAKQANFGIIYGITSLWSCPTNGYSKHEARELMTGLFPHIPKGSGLYGAG